MIVPARVGSIVTTVTATARITPEPSIASAATATEREPIVTGANILGSVGLGLFTFLANLLDVGEKFDQLF